MKNITIIFICLFFCVSQSKAQKTFSKLYNLYEGWEAAYTVVNVSDSDIIINGDFTDRFDPNNVDSPIFNAITLYKVKLNGDLIESNIIISMDISIIQVGKHLK